jgi:alkylation response protein AidB-like acyl-CoA dehydrogenase
MAEYVAPLKDMQFVLERVVGLEQVNTLPGWEEVTDDVVDAILEEAAKLASEVLSPLNASGDREGAKFEDGKVTMPQGFRDAYWQWVKAGWGNVLAPTEFGGQGLPHLVATPIEEMWGAANLAFKLCPMLTQGAVEALDTVGSEELKRRFLPKMVSGEWTGTMNLTEPQAGSDLSLVRTKAVPQKDGTYRLHGQKIFITYGEHDYTENIVHLVLARLPDAPAGSKGISLFIVPKMKVGRDGAVGERNSVRCGALEHKMGIHGSATCVMNFDDAQGWLIGEPNKGLMAMFTMMNTARLAVGLQGLGLSDRAYQNALRYARERLQMRSLSGAKFPDKPADPIIVHPDVRRMLLTQKALIEGGRLIGYHAASLVDIIGHGDDADERAQADALLGFVTPIIKACLTEWGIECTYHALQCFGGHGYIAEHGMEQLARDARITTLYEGTTGIQALDLMGRKIMQLQGAGLRVFLQMIEDFCAANEGNAAVTEFIAPLRAKAAEWQALTLAIGQRAVANADEIGAAAYDYLFYSGYVALAYWWARSVAAADVSSQSDAFKDAKLETARFYFARLLPRTLSHKAAIESGSASLLALDAGRFDA